MRWVPTVVALVWTLVALSANDIRTPAVPGDDFDAWANASWLESTEIPAGRPRWNARDEIAALTQQQLATLLADTALAPPGSDARKVADYRAAALDRAAIEKQGLTPLQPLLARIESVHDKDALARLLGEWTRADVDPVNLGIYDSAHWLGLSVGPGLHGETTNVAYLVQGGLGMASRDSYLDPDKQPLRANYQRYLAHLLQLAGFERAAQRAAAVLRLEVALAQSHATAEASAEERNADNLWKREDFARLAPGVDWARFFEAAGLGEEQALVVWQPSAVTGGAALVRAEPLAVWLDYLRLRALDEYADLLPGVFAYAFTTFHGPTDPDESTKAMSGLIGRLYAERYFPPAQKARVNAIVRNVTAAFRRRVEAVTWMSAASKAVALAKVDAVYFGMGYPEHWPNYSSLEVRADDPVGNRLRLAGWNYREALARLGQPVDRTSWWISPQTSGAVLLFNQNAYNFAAALLQPPKYDAAASEAMSYGAIGAIVGHELSHFVDTLGADYDVNGRKVHWWTPADQAGYEAATAPLVRQFSNYSIASGEHVDGKLALVENVADLAGLSAAFDAYRLTLADRANDADFVRQQDREFFTGYARAWRSRYADDALRKQVATDHAPERFRIATVRNLDAWYQAFDVSPGQKLYLAPRDRAHVW
jgi:predicted metalloendopeptidase